MAFPTQEFVDCVRMCIFDSPETNDLLGKYEFEEKEIMLAAKRAVQRINSTPPLVDAILRLDNFNTEEKYIGLIPGVLGFIYQGAAIREKRNELQYADEGQSIQEDHRYSEYLQFSQIQTNEFDNKIKNIKNMMAEKACFGSVDTQFFFNYFY